MGVFSLQSQTTLASEKLVLAGFRGCWPQIKNRSGRRLLADFCNDFKKKVKIFWGASLHVMRRGSTITPPNRKWQVRSGEGRMKAAQWKPKLVSQPEKFLQQFFLTLGEFYSLIFFTINEQWMRLTTARCYSQQKPVTGTKDEVCPLEMSSFSMTTQGLTPHCWQGINWKKWAGKLSNTLLTVPTCPLVTIFCLRPWKNHLEENDLKTMKTSKSTCAFG